MWKLNLKGCLLKGAQYFLPHTHHILSCIEDPYAVVAVAAEAMLF